MSAIRLPFSISNEALTFFVKGRPYSITKQRAEYAQAKALLLQPGAHPVQQLMDLVDVRAAIVRDSYGSIQLVDDTIVFRGQPLHNVWVDKIFQLRAEGSPVTAIWNALGSLVQNPTEAAIQRLPVFLEKSNLGFLEDGRFIAYKAVRGDYMDIHTGRTFRNMIGDQPAMDRAAVNADPNACCSTGLHVGTPDYVQSFGLGAQGRRVMLIAVWPHDVVSVPHSYEGTKMRITAYEVIDELDEQYAATILGRPLLTPRSELEATTAPFREPPAQAPVVTQSPFEQLRVGDVVAYTSSGADFWGQIVDTNGPLPTVLDIDGDQEILNEDAYAGTIEPDEVTGAMMAFTGCRVEIVGDPALRDGVYEVFGLNEDDDHLQDDGDGATFEVYLQGNVGRSVPVTNGNIVKVFEADGVTVVFPQPARAPATTIVVDGNTVHMTSNDGHDLREDFVEDEDDGADDIEDNDLEDLIPAHLLAKVGDLVTTAEGGFPPAGVYPVIRIDEGKEYRVVVQTEHDGVQGILNRYVVGVQERPWMRVSRGDTVQLRGTDRFGEAYRNGGTTEAVDLNLTGDRPQIQVRTPAGNIWVDADRVM